MTGVKRNNINLVEFVEYNGDKKIYINPQYIISVEEDQADPKKYSYIRVVSFNTDETDLYNVKGSIKKVKAALEIS